MSLHIEQSPLIIHVFKRDCAELTGLMISICILSRSDPLPFPVSSCSDRGLGSKQSAVFLQASHLTLPTQPAGCGAPCPTPQAVPCYQLEVPPSPPPPGDPSSWPEGLRPPPLSLTHSRACPWSCGNQTAARLVPVSLTVLHVG